MGRVASYHDAPLEQVLSDQCVASHPRAHRQNLDVHLRPHRLAEDPFGIGLRPLIGIFVWVNRGMKCVFADTVYRSHKGAAIGVDRHVHPRLFGLDVGVEIGRAQVKRKHFAAHEFALRAAVSSPSDA